MSIIDLASSKSVWRGLDYYERKVVDSWQKLSGETYSGVVSGSNGNKYNVLIDTQHPRKSKCDCPFAEGRRVVCKHMIALYFTVYPQATNKLQRGIEGHEKEEEERRSNRYQALKRYVMSLSKQELQDELLSYLLAEDEDIDYYEDYF